MNVIIGNLWDEVGRADLILVTTNAYITQDHRLVMGRGAAREAAMRYPTLPSLLGDQILRHFKHLGEYGVIVIGGMPGGTEAIGAFQVKRHYREKADPQLIRRSAEGLVLHLAKYPYYQRVAMNFPGIGYGGLAENDVWPHIQDLPENVFIYRWRTE